MKAANCQQMPQETLTLPLVAAFGREGRAGEPEPAPGPPEAWGGGVPVRGGSQQLEREDAAAVISEISSWAKAAGEHPRGGDGAPDPRHHPQSTTHPPLWGWGAAAEPQRSASPCRALPPARSPVPPGVGSPQPLLQPHPPWRRQLKPPDSGPAPSPCRGSSIACTTGAGTSPVPANPGAGGGCAGTPHLPFLLCLRRV